jgi:signal transduction histidine kinase
VITVTDNGIGIQLKDIDHIRPKFTTRVAEWGLGIIKTSSNYKGTITFETEFGKELLLLFRFQ